MAAGLMRTAAIMTESAGATIATALQAHKRKNHLAAHHKAYLGVVMFISLTAPLQERLARHRFGAVIRGIVQRSTGIATVLLASRI